MKARLAFVTSALFAFTAQNAQALPMPCKGEHYIVEIGRNGSEKTRTDVEEFDIPLEFEKGRVDKKAINAGTFELVAEAGCILDEDEMLKFFPGLMFNISANHDVIMAQSKAHISQGQAHLKYIINKTPGSASITQLEIWNLQCQWEPIQLQECE